MNGNAVVTVVVAVVLCGLFAAGAASQPTQPTATTTPTSGANLSDEVSVFMQRSSVGANGSVDSGMWLAGFEQAESQSRREALVERRTATLATRLDELAARLRAFSTDTVDRGLVHSARRARLAADRAVLRTAVSETETAAAGAGVNASGLDRLDRRLDGLPGPTALADST